jgi:hypothetical protein
MKETTPVLHFTVSTGARKFGNDANRVETVVIHIESAEMDAMYLKLLFATGYETGDSAGIFIPNGYQLMHGVESYKQLLRHQNAYLKDIGVLAVEGITQAALTQCITVEGEETTQMSYLMTSKLGLESIEETNHMEERGKWFFLYCKQYAKNVHHFVDYMLANIFDECILKENRHTQVYTPGQTRANLTNFIGSYADALRKLPEPTSNNPQDNNTISTNLAPAHLRKQAATALLMDEFPQLSNQQGKHTTQEEITVESTITSQQTADITTMESHLTEKQHS